MYDEVYQFLQDISILDKPQEKKSSDGPGSGSNLDPCFVLIGF